MVDVRRETCNWGESDFGCDFGLGDFAEEAVEQDGAVSFGEGEEGWTEGFVVVDAVEGGVVVSEGVCDGDAVFEGFDVEGCRLVRVVGGDDLPDLGRFYAGLVGEFRVRWVRGRGVG